MAATASEANPAMGNTDAIAGIKEDKYRTLVEEEVYRLDIMPFRKIITVAIHTFTNIAIA